MTLFISRWLGRSRWELAGMALFAGLLVGLAPVALVRMVRDRGSDFREFYQAGRFVLEHGTRAPDTILAYYWPSLDAAWAGLAGLPFGAAAVVWYLAGCLAWVGLLATVGSRLLRDWPPDLRRQGPLAAGLLLMPLAAGHLCLGAFHILMLWLMVAGLAEASIGRWRRGGLLLGLAIWIKLLPLAAAGYLVWKRQWKPALLAVLAALALDAGLSIAAFGTQAAWASHQQWWRAEVRGTATGILENSYSLAEHRSTNQSLAAIMRRTLTLFMVEEAAGHWETFSLVGLSTRQVKLLYVAVMAVLAAWLAFVFRRPSTRMTPPDWATEIALVALATVWFSPIAWSYHFVAAAPALSLVLVRATQRPKTVWFLVALVVVALCLLGSVPARAYGVLLLTSAVLGAAVLRLQGVGRDGTVDGLT